MPVASSWPRTLKPNYSIALSHDKYGASFLHGRADRKNDEQRRWAPRTTLQLCLPVGFVADKFMFWMVIPNAPGKLQCCDACDLARHP